MARLPQPGQDKGTWGNILNDFLSQAHKPDGTLKDNSVTANTIAPGAVTKATVGLTHVDNTADVDKPISTTTQTALNTKQATATLATDAAAHISDGSALETAVVAKIEMATDELVEPDGPVDERVNLADDQATSASVASLPNLYKTTALYNDLTAADIWFMGLGSSVSLGPNGTLDAVNSISAYFHTKVGGFLNRLGNISTEHHNGGVGGTTLTDGYVTGYAAAKAAAGGVIPKVVTIGFGMNDGMPSQYHAGQTFPFVYSRMLQLIDAVRADGGDVVVFTTPHPHSARVPWSSGVGSPTYPSATPLPALTASASVVDVPAPRSGNMVPASYRHLKVNGAMRQAANERGAVLIDVEPLWFEAIDKYGEDALYDAGQYNHPNLFAYQQSYHKGIDRFVRSLSRPTIQASAPKATAGADAYPIGYQDPGRYRPNNGTPVNNSTVMVSDNQLFYDFPTIAAATIWEITGTLFYSTPAAADIKIGWLSSDPATFSLGTSRWSVRGVGTGAVWATNTAPDVALVPNLNSSDFSGRSALMDSTITVGGNGADAGVEFTARVRVPAGGAKRLTLQIAQAVATVGNTTLYDLSDMRARRMA